MDFMGRGDFKAKFGAELDGTRYRWVRSRYRWLTLVRDLAERLYRWQQAVRGRVARRRWRRFQPPEPVNPVEPARLHDEPSIPLAHGASDATSSSRSTTAGTPLS